MAQAPTPGKPQRHVVVMGVSGVGKTTVAEQLARRLGYQFAEGDDFHPRDNVAKMSAGVPLDDEDRMPWLQALAAWVRERDQQGRSTVLTCSALRRRYRDVLREGSSMLFVHLVGDEALLATRMGGRDHFMPPELLRSQFEALEPLGDDEPGMTVEVRDEPERVVERVLEGLQLA